MNTDQKEQLDQHLKAIAQILVDNTPEEQLYFARLQLAFFTQGQ
ncbi:MULTISPECIES: hypothetical protein [Microcystis]|jgi:hypothetical protein|uniref:Uncharacterized protein n=1 Tax=Microcystis viridis NIES-102 TaxID=213615 RepID=A0A3G9JNV7_MICVR|nr:MULTISPECIES: hypothetical protein [Microcystis]BBH39601.1 hypothetical protein myaer102_21370 [Microcystis viridis NIES-102]